MINTSLTLCFDFVLTTWFIKFRQVRTSVKLWRLCDGIFPVVGGVCSSLHDNRVLSDDNVCTALLNYSYMFLLVMLT